MVNARRQMPRAQLIRAGHQLLNYISLLDPNKRFLHSLQDNTLAQRPVPLTPCAFKSISLKCKGLWLKHLRLQDQDQVILTADYYV